MTPIRRIVTGHDASGSSCFVQDEALRAPYHPGDNHAHAIYELWRSEQTPACNDGPVFDPAGPVQLAPPSQGCVLRIIDLPPDRQRDFSQMASVFSAYGTHGVLDQRAPRHPAFHRTRSLDYAMVLEGEVWALMDEGETLMRPGDVLIQRGTNHAWSNRSEANCRLLFVLVDAQSPVTGSQNDQEARHANA